LTDTPPDQSAKNLGNFFRQFRIKDELPAWGYASQLDRLSMLIPGSVESFVTSVTSDPSREMQGKGYSIQDILLANVMAPRSGLSGDDAAKKLVESLSGAISAGTGNVNGKSGSALQELGLLDKDGRSPVMAGGHLDFLTFLQRLNAFETKVLGEVANPDEARRKIGSTFERAFGPADHIASGLARPDAIDATQKLATHPADPSLPTVQTAFDEGSVSRQFDVAKANLETTLIQVGKELLPTLIETLRLVNANISNLNGYLAQHPAAAKDIGLTTELGTGGLLGLLALSKFRTPLWRLATNPWAAGPLVAGGLAAAGIYGTTQQAQQFQKQLDKTGESDAVKGIMMSNRFSGDGVKSMPMDPIDLRGLWKKLQSLPPVDPGGFLPMSFTMPGDQRVPTMERAVALSKTDTPGKPSPLNVQVQPGKVVINLDGRTIATAVMEFMARQTGGPNTGPADFNSAGRLTPAGTQSGVYAT
jgi:hypothetical protein